MPTKLEAEERIEAAVQGCKTVHVAWNKGVDVLCGDVSVNGYGIFKDPCAFRAKLMEGQAQIQIALQTLKSIEWPSEADYEQI